MEVKFVAEVSSNHNKDINRCFSFIECAAGLGCHAVKFQLFRVGELFAPEILSRSKDHRDRVNWELPLDFLPELSKLCKSLDIQFSCTPFYIKAVEELFPFVDFYKIASYELLWNDLLKECAQTGKPIVLSTGMATLEEISRAVNILHGSGCDDLTLLHCVSGYPTPLNECNLAAIKTIRRHFGCDTGWSDHSVNEGIIYRAVHCWGATMVEFHLDLDGRGDEYKTGHCWLPEKIKPVIGTIRDGCKADGTGEKIPSPSELTDREWRADPLDGLRPLIHKRTM